VVIQLVMVILVMTSPGMVIGSKETVSAADRQNAMQQLDNIQQIEIPGIDLGAPPKF
jgi:hypothetical protein